MDWASPVYVPGSLPNLIHGAQVSAWSSDMTATGKSFQVPTPNPSASPPCYLDEARDSNPASHMRFSWADLESTGLGLGEGLRSQVLNIQEAICTSYQQCAPSAAPVPLTTIRRRVCKSGAQNDQTGYLTDCLTDSN